MSKQTEPEAAVSQILTTGADRDYAAAHDWSKQTAATEKPLSLPNEEKPAEGEELVGAILPMVPSEHMTAVVAHQIRETLSIPGPDPVKGVAPADHGTFRHADPHTARGPDCDNETGAAVEARAVLGAAPSEHHQRLRRTMSRPTSGQVLPGEFLLRDGTPALIWPLLPTDAEALRDGFRRLSGDSRQHRFLQTLDQLDDSMIRRLVDSVDGVHHIALVLVVLPPEGEEGPVGVARLLQYPDDPATADIAVTVADDWQGRGAGTVLVSALLERRPAAVTRLRTVVDAGNRASLALLAGAGRMSSGMPERGVLDVTVELAAA